MLIGLLEDDLAIQEMLRLLLQGEGYTVVAYASPEECQAALRFDDSPAPVTYPDLLMIDLHLARSVSGLTVIEQLRTSPHLVSLPVILMTASTFIDKQDLQRLNVTLLPKPFDIDEIIHIVHTLTQA